MAVCDDERYRHDVTRLLPSCPAGGRDDVTRLLPRWTWRREVVGMQLCIPGRTRGDLLFTSVRSLLR